MEKMTLTVQETALYLGLGLNKTYELIHAKVIPSLKLGRQFKVPRIALETWLLNKSNDKLA